MAISKLFNACTCICIVCSAGTASAFDLAGFKTVTFGASAETLTTLGYACTNSSGRMECQGNDTLFGIPAGVRVWFKDGKADSIRVIAMDKKPIDLVAAYTKALGKPMQFTDAAWRNGTITVYYWLAKNGTSISTFVDTDCSMAVRASDGNPIFYNATADYRDKSATHNNLLDQAKKANKQIKDF